ncbi:MAG: hypothetical protein H6608_08160 [Flavobacteriales bacterium]|nr:hypothetical protein [Flavobacteriales bacterium]
MQKFISFVMVAVTLTACTSTSEEHGNNGNRHLSVYKQAVKAKDDYTAIVALNYILDRDSSNTEYTDSLARLYMRNGVFEAGIKLGEKLLNDQPNNDVLMEMVAESQGITGDYTNAVKKYNKLYEKNHNLVYLFQLAKIESNRNAPEAYLQRLDQILADSGTTLVEFPSVQGAQMVDIKAAAYYLKGQLYFNMGNTNVATEYIKKALAVSPDFQAAQIGVQQIKEMSQSGGAQPQRQLSKAELDQLQYEQYLRQQGGR